MGSQSPDGVQLRFQSKRDVPAHAGKGFFAAAEDVRYEVEWVSKLPTDANGDSDWNRAIYECNHRNTPDEAIALARELLGKGLDMVGEIRITEEIPCGIFGIWTGKRELFVGPASVSTWEPISLE